MITQGPGLVFVVFPHALAKMPLPQFWSVVFFGMLVLLGIDSQFATVEVIITSLKVRPSLVQLDEHNLAFKLSTHWSLAMILKF